MLTPWFIKLLSLYLFKDPIHFRWNLFIYNYSFNFKSSYISVKFKEYEYSPDVQVSRVFLNLFRQRKGPQHFDG